MEGITNIAFPQDSTWGMTMQEGMEAWKFEYSSALVRNTFHSFQSWKILHGKASHSIISMMYILFSTESKIPPEKPCQRIDRIDRNGVWLEPVSKVTILARPFITEKRNLNYSP
jgi:hypothetical protein